MNVGASIRAIRESRGMTQEDLAKKILVSQSMLCQVERGTKSPSFPLVVDISKALGCEVSDFINDTQQNVSMNETVEQSKVG